MLCTECQIICAEDLDQNLEDPTRDGTSFPDFEPLKPFKSSFSALKKSALDGCRICHYIWQLFKNDQRYNGLSILEEVDQLPVRFQWWATDDYREGKGFVQIYRPKPPEESGEIDFMHQTGLFVFLEISTDRGICNPWSKNRNIETNPLSEKAVSLMEQWLQNCLDDHPECKQELCYTHSICGRPLTSKLPTRVIDVGSENSEPRLISGENLHGSYAALSHCWGHCTRTTTTQNNTERMMQCMPLSEFSPAFRDAIIVCRRLDIPYLWIDSICIIQDDTEDWNREASNMASIYKNSHVVLAAARNTDSQQSFLRKRSDLLAGCELNESLGGVFIRPETKGWRREVNLSIYNTRAWCYQEQQLSSRILYFCEDELSWYCKHGWQREALAGNVFTGFEYNVHLFERWKDKPKAQVPVDATAWYEIVTPYTMKRMTFPEDKLPALSGIAAEVQQVTGSKYLAGLWRDSLIPSLLWTRLYTSKLGNEFFVRAKGDAAPSWSWASCDGVIKYDHNLFKPKSNAKWLYHEDDENKASLIAPRDLVTVLDAYTTLFDEKYPLGRVTGGKLTLQGPCRDFTYSQFLNNENEENPAIITNEHHAVLSPISAFDLNPIGNWKDDDELTCMLCRICQSQSWQPSDDASSMTIFGLILRLVKGQTNVYQRVGCGSGKVGADGEEFEYWAQRTVQII